jgi:hypothetical protein
VVVEEATGWTAGRYRHVQVSELFSMEEWNQVYMDLLAATEGGKLPPKCMMVRSRCRG